MRISHLIFFGRHCPAVEPVTLQTFRCQSLLEKDSSQPTGLCAHIELEKSSSPVYFLEHYQTTIDEINDIGRSTIPRSRSIKYRKLNEYFCISFRIMISALDGVVIIGMAWSISSASLNLGRRGSWEASREVNSGGSDKEATMAWGRVCSIISATLRSGRRERLEASREVSLR